MELISELSKLALNAARRGDTVEASQLIELAATAQRARAERIDRLLSFVERLEKLIDQGGATGPDQSPVAEPGA